MIIEELFGEVCAMNGDRWNAEYLHRSVPGAELRRTALTETPYFATETPDIITIGSMTERTQKSVIERLRPYRERLQELIDGGTVILATGNAGEVFSRAVVNVTDGVTLEGLGLLDFETRTDLFNRYFGKVLATFEDMKILGFQCRFGAWYGTESCAPFLQMARGRGDHADCPTEGFRRNRFFCTSLLGPILPMNPLFTEYLLRLAGADAQAAYREEAMTAYDRRLKEFELPEMHF